LLLLVLLGIGLLRTRWQQPLGEVAFERRPEGIMGTSCHLVVVMDPRRAEDAKRMLDKAEYRLRYLESLASNWIRESEISQFNQLQAGQSFQLSSANWTILQASRQAWVDTDGAFDVTCRPLIELWKQAGVDQVLPAAEDIAAARELSRWDHLEFGDDRMVSKTHAGLRVDLGGVAKGFAIDEALDAMRELGASGGMVEVGGDLRFFGASPGSTPGWMVKVRDPEGGEASRELLLKESLSVCTSGDYARFVTIGGRRYSHILNPVSGYPCESVPSVTVIAPTAMEADIWATALSVLGPDGLKRLPEPVQAWLQVREADASIRNHFSANFPDLALKVPMQP
jgi:thiamine biosynthesis lipoprotein